MKENLNEITNYIHKEGFALRKVLLTWFLICCSTVLLIVGVFKRNL